VNPNEDFVLVLVATVSAFCWPWAFVANYPRPPQNGAVIVATTAGYQGRQSLAS
jgi:hypothetical protein